MAILDTTKKKFVIDTNDNIYTGIDLPFRLGGAEGYFASTRTTIEAIKNDIANLLLTNTGERVMQPTLGLNLRRYLFQQLNSETIEEMKLHITNSISEWLPFVNIASLNIIIDRETNSLIVSLQFTVNGDNTTYDTLNVGVGELQYDE